MVKSIVVFDGIKDKPRRTLNNKRIFASFKGNQFLNDTLDYLYYSYDLDKVKNIFVMGDGAKWIRTLTNHFQINNETNVVFALDKYHFKQAIHHICLDKTLENVLNSYVLNNDKKNFKLFYEEFIKSYSHRTDTINQKKEYIINNWKNILNLYKYNLSCPIKSQISHNLAYLLSSRPKGYSLKMLDKILKIRLLFKNNENIKQLYLNNFNIKETIDYKKEQLKFDILDKYKQLTPYYKDKIFNPSIGQYYSYNNL